MKGWTLSLVALVAMTGARPGADRHQAGHRLRQRRQVRQILQRGRLQRRREVQRRRPRSPSPSSSPRNETQFEQALRRFAQRGQDPIIAVGFSQAVALEKVAKEFPNIHFTIIDSVVKLPNVQSVVFKEHEGSFLVGMLAAMASQDRQGRLRRRHGHPADPPVPVRLRAGHQVRQSQGRADLQHDRHDARRLERSGPRRRARQGPVRPRRRRRLCRGRQHRHRHPAGGQGPRQATASASIPTRTTCIPAPC